MKQSGKRASAERASAERASAERPSSGQRDSARQPGAQSGARSARGERARAGLKKAALSVLERQGFHKMRIADVTGEAGVAQGLFYHYFSDLKSLTLEVLTDFAMLSSDPADIERDVPRGDWYARIYAHNLRVVRSYARRPGVMRCMLQMADEDPEFSAMLRDSYRQQLMWLVELMPRLFPDVRFKRNQALLIVYALAGVGEGLMREYFINESKTLRAAQLSVEEFAELLSTMFYRGLFLANPDQAQLKYTSNLAAMVRQH